MIRRVLATLTALLVVLLALLVWQLSQGPLSLAFAVPYLEDAIHGEHDDWRVAIGDLALMTDLKIHARDVELLAADGQPLLRVPDAVIRPSLRALLYGMVAVSAVEIDGAQAHVLRRADGSFGVAIAEPAEAAAGGGGAEFLEDLLEPVGTDHVVDFLRHFRISNAHLTIADLETGAAWTVSNATIALARGAHHHQLTVDAGLVGEKPSEEGGHFEARLDVRPDGEGFVFDGSARATDIEAARLALYWPQNAAVSARRWVTKNVRRGRVTEVDLEIALASTSGTDLHLTKLSGNMRYEGLEVRWGDDVPPVTGVNGTSAFDRSSMRFAITQGSAAEIRVRSGRVSLFDLDTDAEHIAIEVKGDGPIASAIGLAPEAAAELPFKTTGDAGLDVRAAFPLSAKLSFADVDLKVDAEPRSVAIHHERAAATVSGSLRYQKRARRQATLSADLEVESAHFDAGGVRWTQPAGKRGTADFQLALGGETLTFEPLRLDCPGLRGRGVLTLGGGARDGGTAQLSNLVFGDTELDKAQVEWRPSAIKVRLGRGTVDLGPLFDDDGGGGAGANGGRPIDLDIETGVLRRVSLKGRSVENVEGKLMRRDGIWQEIDVRGELPQRESAPAAGATNGTARKLTARLSPTGTGWRLEAGAGDFGGLLYAAGVSDGVHGGVLEISGRADRAAAGAVVRSHVKVTNFVLRGAPLALRILSVAALERFVSTLRGEGLHFDSLKGTVIARGDRYELDNLRAHGSSLGWTADGWVDSGADQLRVDGTVIPAYQANKVLRKVPFLGGLLTGSDRRALIAINYSVRGDLADPKVSTNALSALTPGFLREVWDLGN